MNAKISRRSRYGYEYGPFGEVFCSVGDMTKVNPFQFSTKYTDNETDLLYYGYRYYSPALGRWLSRDPIEEQGGLNLYGFVNNDPVNKWDKLGLKWVISRLNKRNYALARASKPSDTFDDLGRLVGLDTKDYQVWAHTDDAAPDICKKYKIPNTIFIEFGAYEYFDSGPIPSWKRYFKKLGKQWEKEGFKVVLIDPSTSEISESHLKNEYIYGFVYAGHGAGAGGNCEFVFSKIDELPPKRYTQYGISFFYAYGCGLALKEPLDPKLKYPYLHSEWEINVATRGKFYGIWGDVNWADVFFVDHVISTGGVNYE